MADFETKVRVSAKTQGFDKVQQESAKLQAAQKALFQATRQGFSDSKKAITEYKSLIGSLEDQLQSTAKAQLELQEAILGTDKGSEVYKKLTEEMKKLDQQSSQVRKTIALVEQGFKKEARAAKEAGDAAKAAAGAFRQGFAQGAGVGEFLQRGPGMFRQAAGRMLGRATIGIPRGVAGGALSMPFTGVGGMLQGIQSIPGGGLIAAPFQNAMGFAGGAVGLQQQRLQTAPFLFGGGTARSIEAARAAGIARGPGAGEEAVRAGTARLLAGERPIDPRMVGRENMVALPSRGESGSLLGRIAESVLGKPVQAFGVRPGAEQEIRAKMMDEAEASERAKIRAERQEGGARAARDARRRALAPIREAGLDLGAMAEPEALQFAGQLAQRGGGSLQDLQRTGLLRAGVAAQTAFGVGPEVTGALQLGARRGGVVGGMGGDRMADMIGDAMKLGLEGSEITDYLEQMAEGIEQWRATGIPLNPDTINSLGQTFGRTGLGGVQGQRVGKGIQARAQQIAVGGPQGAADMLLLQSLGGFKGGGIGDLQEARKRLETGKFGPEEIQGFLQNLTTQTGGGPAGEAALQAAMNQLGITMGPTQAGLLLSAGRGEKASPEQQRAIEEFETQAKAGARLAPTGAGGLEKMARELVAAMGPNLKQQAAIQNQQLDVGMKLVPAMQKFEQSTTTTAAIIGDFGTEIKAVADVANEMAMALRDLVKFLRNNVGEGGRLGLP